jgi:hypothetical protein
MTEPRQRPIPVTSQERMFLEQQKQRYESQNGSRGDWGQFLGAIALLGLAAIGVYTLANATNRSPQSVDVRCSVCSNSFVMALPSGAGRVVYTRCPHCQSELVVSW